MHLLIPFAAPASPLFAKASAGLKLPALEQILGRCEPSLQSGESESSLSAPHEAAYAQAQGWQGGDGLWPLAAQWARRDGVSLAEGSAWGLLTPGHWQASADDVVLLDPTALNLSDSESRELLALVRGLFEDLGWALHFGAATRWYVQHASLAAQPTASLDRVRGRSVQAWLQRTPQAVAWRRLQSELQMLLYTAPLNARREARGELAVNSFWLSGTGVAQRATVEITVDERLRQPALALDVPAWARAWAELDAECLSPWWAQAARNRDARLTLCGERHAVTFAPARGGLLRGLTRQWQRWRRPSVAQVLEPL